VATAAKPRKLKAAPFTILADNREQWPYRFATAPRAFGYSEVCVQRGYLVTGDYTISGLEDRFALERKSLEDLYATLGQNRRRFEAEVQRLNSLDFAAIIIEASLAEIWRPMDFRNDWKSRLWPKSVEGTIASWSIRYPRVHWWPVGSRSAGEIRAFGACEKFWKQTTESKGATK